MVSSEEGRDLAKKMGFLFLETSALNNKNDCVAKAFYILLKDILDKNGVEEETVEKKTSRSDTQILDL